jgi:hypothetical protein
MGFDETRIGWLCLVVSLTLSVALFAGGTHESRAYFTDTKFGAMTGTCAHIPPVPTIPYRPEPGTSKALHWGLGSDGPEFDRTIAQRDPSGALFLDFGQDLAGHGDSRPDVFRLVSLAKDSRIVTFSVSGPLARFVTVVRLGNGDGDQLAAGAEGRVYVKFRVPDDALPGAYTGAITFHVQGWAEDARIPATFEVCDEKRSCGQGHALADSPGGCVDSSPSPDVSPVPLTDHERDDQGDPNAPVPDPDPGPDASPSPESTPTPSPTSTLSTTPTAGAMND